DHRIESRRLAGDVAIGPQSGLAQERRQHPGVIGKSAIDRFRRRITGEHDLTRPRHLHQRKPERASHGGRVETEYPAGPRCRAEIAQELPREEFFAWPPARPRDRRGDPGPNLPSPPPPRPALAPPPAPAPPPHRHPR